MKIYQVACDCGAYPTDEDWESSESIEASCSRYAAEIGYEEHCDLFGDYESGEVWVRAIDGSEPQKKFRVSVDYEPTYFASEIS